jgi:translation initiation factor 4A
MMGYLFQHSDLSDGERHAVLEKFQKAVIEWNQSLQDNTERTRDNEYQEAHSHLLVITDACLPSQALSEAPLCARMLINYDLPVKKVVLTYFPW